MSDPPSVRPVSCQVHWVLGEGTFSGNVLWSVAMEEPVAEIKIHAEMKLDTMRITQYKKAAKIQKSETQKDGQITILLAEPLQPGRAEIAASFTSKFGDSVGIHYSGQSQCVQTHFEVSHARKALPCFDLTPIKAKFRVTITAPGSTSTAFSNMPLLSQRSTDAATTFEFEETPPIPAYVLAFAVIPTEVTTLSEEVTLHGGSVVPLSCHTVPKYNAKYPLDVVLKAAVLGLQLCSEWLQIDYPLPKLDVLVVPKLCLGGMENHGLVFLDGCETAPGKGKKGGADSLVELLMHEIAHMWCGNMVGFDFWVKEGLAQFFEKVLADSFLGRASSLPREGAKVTLADVKAVSDSKDKEKEVVDKKKNKKKPSKKDLAAAAAAAAAGPKEASDAVDNHDVFNGNMYTKSYLWTCGVEREFGRQEFLSRLSTLLSEHQDLFVSEDTFLKAFGQA